MTKSELERLERIAAQLLGGLMASPVFDRRKTEYAKDAIEQAQELIKQLDALKIAE